MCYTHLPVWHMPFRLAIAGTQRLDGLKITSAPLCNSLKVTYPYVYIRLDRVNVEVPEMEDPESSTGCRFSRLCRGLI